MKKTLINVKLRASRRVRDAASLGLILVGFLLGLVFVAGAQVVLCRQEHPGRSVSACLSPLRNLARPR